MSFNEKAILNAPVFDGRKKYISLDGNKIKFSQILVIPNSTCSLRCKYCAAGNQYAVRKEFEVIRVLSDFDKLLSVCKTKQANIQGGEVFLHSRLAEFFEMFPQMEHIGNCDSIALFTNATVIPTDEQLEAYRKIKIPKRFIISNYKLPNVKLKKFVSTIEQFDLDYVILPEENYWLHPGSPKREIGYTDDELKEVVRRCTKFGRAPKLIDGRFFACGQNGYALYHKLNDYVDVRNCPDFELESEIYKHIYEPESYDICRYCRGQFEDCERISVAEQMRNEVC